MTKTTVLKDTAAKQLGQLKKENTFIIPEVWLYSHAEKKINQHVSWQYSYRKKVTIIELQIKIRKKDSKS